MFIQFLIEDLSGEKLLDAIMGHYKREHIRACIEYSTLSYKGIGGFVKDANARNVKSQKLLNDLPKRLRAFNSVLQHRADAALFIVLDNDKNEPTTFKNELENMAIQTNIEIDHVFCIAVEEMEAWLLGDIAAIQAAYPKLADRVATKHAHYKQDSICDTWEVLADMLTARGIGRFRKENPTYREIGRRKSQWASEIGEHLSIRDNMSSSFQGMLNALDQRLYAVVD